MTDPIRQQIATAADLIVVKVGTRVLTGPDGLLDSARIDSLGRQIDAVSSDGRRVVLVSSGAVGAGMGRIGLTKRPSELAQLQAVAAIGQSCLIEAYERALRGRGRHELDRHGLERRQALRRQTKMPPLELAEGPLNKHLYLYVLLRGIRLFCVISSIFFIFCLYGTSSNPNSSSISRRS